MNNPVFLVEGGMEMLIIQNICPKYRVIPLKCNGKDVKIKDMAEKIISKIFTLGNRYYPIIIVVDKEDRNLSYDDMAKELKKYIINNEDMKNQDLRIAVADRMTENWILADLKCKDSANLIPPQTDGINAKSFIKKNINKHYNEKADGVEYFKNAKAQNILQHSPSFKYFIDQIKDIDCYYINFY